LRRIAQVDLKGREGAASDSVLAEQPVVLELAHDRGG
jgi:hypothetical protein